MKLRDLKNLSVREKILISFKSVSKNLSRTAFPKEPVPPVINSILSVNNQTSSSNI